MKRADQLAAVKKYALSKLSHDKTGHGMDHINRVVRMSKRLAIGENVDPFLPIVAAYLHDTIDEKLVTNVSTAKQELVAYLQENKFNADQINNIMNVINNISFAHTLDGEQIKLSIVGQIVRDADWLDAIGAIGITRAIYYGGGHHEKIYDPAIKPRHNMSREEYRNLANETIINHFDEKLLHLKDMMNTTTAKKIATHRQQVMLNYLDEFHAEWNAEK
ncbi:HD domain-containing protein [Limosilactobacillus walteri]|uniref:HD domain-containing protein n=1 Tax=Limosilactobacillus walteri TaxID=2268022 RepID=A0ABR8P7I5_9LACO|nr:HD domain-containing protein [Limosilactobacillus walteri]MBD5806703.1 HD domain-containing protein [Limosilactobacillus walteri]